MAAVKKIFISLYFKLLKHLVLQKLTINKKKSLRSTKIIHFVLLFKTEADRSKIVQVAN